MQRVQDSALYEWHPETANHKLLTPCLIRAQHGDSIWEQYDPYSFTTSITADELYLFGEGRLKEAYKMLGAHIATQQGVSGVRFAVWAPNAERVSVVGNFNQWDGRTHPMRAHGSSGVWELFIPGLQIGELYKYEIRNRQSGNILVKTDP